jgi:hypothetical protein
MKNFTKIVTVQQHEIRITRKTTKIPDPYIMDKLIDDISWELNKFRDSGLVKFNNESYKWEMIEPKSYLEQKVEILEDKGEVVFEHDCMIYTISQSCEGGYEINMYDMHTDNFISGDTLDADDGGHCDGNAKDAVYFMLKK